MGLRYRKSFKIAPGVRFNVNKKSVGVSVGVKGARVSINSKGQKTTTVGIPGSGLYYTTTTSIRNKTGRKGSDEGPNNGYKNPKVSNQEIYNFVGTLPTNILLIKDDRNKYVQTRGFSWLTLFLGPIYFVGRTQFLPAFAMLFFDLCFLAFPLPIIWMVLLQIIMSFISKRTVVYRLIKKGWVPVLDE